MHTKYGYVPNARKKICLFGNELLPKFYDSFKARAGGNIPEMKKMFIAERDRQYFINQNGLETKISRTFLDFLHLGHEFFAISGHGT